jgi:asparagine synthase (glutamine-hydrolysing)
MFAIAIWDADRRVVHLVRDRIGIKPLYFTFQGGKAMWASEIKALLAHPDVPRELEPIGMYHYLSFMTTPAPLTMFKGIYKIPAAHRIELPMDGQPSMRRYWDVMAEGRGYFTETDDRFYVDETRRLLEAAVESHMMSDVPYGAFLSGGVDSSTNVALMKKYSDRPVSTFTVGFSDHTDYNEMDHAKRVAGMFGTRHHEILIDETDMSGYLDQLVHSQDEPLADWVCIPLYFVSKLVRDSGTTVVQVGEGADEQLCGYASYMGYLDLQRKYFAPFQRFVPGPLRDAAAWTLESLAAWRVGLEPYAELVRRAASGREAFWTGALVFHDSHKHKLIPDADRIVPGVDPALVEAGIVPKEMLDRDSFSIVSAQYGEGDRLRPGADYLTRMTYNEFQTRLPELLLMRVDKITMSTSIEARVPFLDHKLVEFTMRIPMASKLKGGMPKYIGKKIAEEFLPKDLVYRKKMGFAAPMAAWLRGDFGRRVEAELMASSLLGSPVFDRDRIAEMVRRHREGRQDNSTQIWTLYNLVCWHRHWIEGH